MNNNKRYLGNSKELSVTLSTTGHQYASVLSKSESVKLSQIESVTYLFTDSPVKKYISLLNQLIFTESISGI